MATHDEYIKTNHADNPMELSVQPTSSRLASVFMSVLGVSSDRIHPDLGPGEVVRWDSVGHVVLVTAIEEEFSIHFEEDEIMEFTSFKDILMAVERRMAKPTSEICDGPGARA